MCFVLHLRFPLTTWKIDRFWLIFDLLPKTGNRVVHVTP